MNKDGVDVIKKDGYVDYLYRVAVRALIRNEKGDILVVKERNHDWWSLPGGGLDYGESVEDCLRRELKEEINLDGDFDHQLVALEEPGWNERLGAMQLNATFEVNIGPDYEPNLGVEGAEVEYIPLERLYSENGPNSRIITSLNSIFNTNK